jgi:hypothetical protein
MEPQKLVKNPFSEPLYDQFALGDKVGYINSSRMMRILRYLRKHSPQGEGKLAKAVDEKMFHPDWPELINTLLQWGWIKGDPTGHGRALEISLTAKGEEFLHERLDPRPAPVEAEKSGEAFAKSYLELTGTPLE